MRSSFGRWPRTRCPRRPSLALLEVARAYLAIADPAGAGAAVAEAERILHRRPDLGVLVEQLAELRQRSRGAAQALAGPSTLTPAELRVLPMLSTHLKFEEIAERLYVSRHTVKAQIVSIYAKLGVSSRGEAVDRAIEIGLLEPFPGLRLTGSGVAGLIPPHRRIALTVRCERGPRWGSIHAGGAGVSPADAGRRSAASEGVQ